MCVCVCVCVRARVRVCVCGYNTHIHTHTTGDFEGPVVEKVVVFARTWSVEDPVSGGRAWGGARGGCGRWVRFG